MHAERIPPNQNNMSTPYLLVIEWPFILLRLKQRSRSVTAGCILRENQNVGEKKGPGYWHYRSACLCACYHDAYRTYKS